MLDKAELEQTLSDWNYWKSSPPLTIPRKALASIEHLNSDLVLAIQGIRRCGKSTLLFQIMNKLNLDPLDCTFVNFEDPRLSGSLNHELLEMIVTRAHERKSKSHYFFLDEIQNVEDWQKWLHMKTERPGSDHFVITGSNSSLLSGDLASSLTGRHVTLELFPFDFEEFLVAQPHSSLEHFFELGGFPRVLSYPKPDQLLREYFNGIIERDVRRHVAARSALSLVQCVKAVFETTGSETSQRTLAKMLGVSADTVGSYLDACESAYMILPCPYFSFSEKQRSARHRKYYPSDLGLRRAVVTKTGLDLGKCLETIVFHTLRKRTRQVYYWRGKGEVDFVVHDEKGVTPYQVSWESPKERHYEALDEFKKTFPDSNAPRFIHRDNFSCAL